MAWDTAQRFTTLTCRCRSGLEQRFEVRVDPINDAAGLGGIYMAKPLQPERQGNKQYLASFTRVGPTRVQLEFASNDLPEAYHGCHITATLLPLVAKHLTATIQSSRRPGSKGESRNQSATKMWEQMVNAGTARYDPKEDRFYHLG